MQISWTAAIVLIAALAAFAFSIFLKAPEAAIFGTVVAGLLTQALTPKLVSKPEATPVPEAPPTKPGGDL